MFDEWLSAVQTLELARALRDSVWAYPLINAGHLLGISLLVGAIIPLDLRLLGAWPSLPLAPLWRVLTVMAGAGLVIAIVCGSLLFITRATEYAASTFFLAKMSVVVAGVINAVVLLNMVARIFHHTVGSSIIISRRVRYSAGLSLVIWLGALILGRLVGYF